MGWVDYLLLGVIAVSVVISIVRGFVREAMSLASWVLALWVGLTFAERLGRFLEGVIAAPLLRWIIGFAVLLVVTLILGGIVSHLIAKVVKHTGLSGTDRSIGALFGAARGVVVVGILVLVLGLTSAREAEWWKGSVLIPRFEPFAAWLMQLLPDDLDFPEQNIPGSGTGALPVPGNSQTAEPTR